MDILVVASRFATLSRRGRWYNHCELDHTKAQLQSPGIGKGFMEGRPAEATANRCIRSHASQDEKYNVLQCVIDVLYNVLYNVFSSYS